MITTPTSDFNCRKKLRDSDSKKDPEVGHFCGVGPDSKKFQKLEVKYQNLPLVPTSNLQKVYELLLCNRGVTFTYILKVTGGTSEIFYPDIWQTFGTLWLDQLFNSMELVNAKCSQRTSGTRYAF